MAGNKVRWGKFGRIVVSAIVVIVGVFFMFFRLEQIKDNAIALAVGASFTGSFIFWFVVFLMYQKRTDTYLLNKLEAIEQEIKQMSKELNHKPKTKKSEIETKKKGN